MTPKCFYSNGDTCPESTRVRCRTTHYCLAAGLPSTVDFKTIGTQNSDFLAPMILKSSAEFVNIFQRPKSWRKCPRLHCQAVLGSFLSQTLRTMNLWWKCCVSSLGEYQAFSLQLTGDECPCKAVSLTWLRRFFVDAIEAPHTFEQFRTASVGHILRPLIRSLSDRCHHPDIISTLL